MAQLPTLPVYTHPACLGHDTGPGHAEVRERLDAVLDALRTSGLALDWRIAPQATREQLLRVHDPRLLESVLDVPVTERVALDPDTVLSPASPDAALHAAGAVVAAVDGVLSGGVLSGGVLSDGALPNGALPNGPRRAFCAVRPPGHHATADTAMGFCLFNSVAVAAAHALAAHGLARVAIVDFDVHHGNGSQDIFAAEPRVQYLSTHQLPLYPDSGHAYERGVGNIRNVPLPPGTGSRGFRAAWADVLLPELDAFRPELVLVSAGFDAHWRDPLAQLQLDAADYAWITAELLVVADRHAGGRLVSTLEGGYDLQALRESSVAHVAVLVDGLR